MYFTKRAVELAKRLINGRPGYIVVGSALFKRHSNSEQAKAVRRAEELLRIARANGQHNVAISRHDLETLLVAYDVSNRAAVALKAANDELRQQAGIASDLQQLANKLNALLESQSDMLEKGFIQLVQYGNSDPIAAWDDLVRLLKELQVAAQVAPQAVYGSFPESGALVGAM